MNNKNNNNSDVFKFIYDHTKKEIYSKIRNTDYYNITGGGINNNTLNQTKEIYKGKFINFEKINGMYVFSFTPNNDNSMNNIIRSYKTVYNTQNKISPEFKIINDQYEELVSSKNWENNDSNQILINDMLNASFETFQNNLKSKMNHNNNSNNNIDGGNKELNNRSMNNKNMNNKSMNKNNVKGGAPLPFEETVIIKENQQIFGQNKSKFPNIQDFDSQNQTNNQVVPLEGLNFEFISSYKSFAKIYVGIWDEIVRFDHTV